MTEVRNGDVVRVHYSAKLTDGTEFDSSVGREPLELQVGAGQVIEGLDRRLDGMAVGEKSTVAVPAEEAYGLRDEAQVKSVPRSAVPRGYRSRHQAPGEHRGWSQDHVDRHRS
jgi:peptidylprolyl isomerase